MNKETRRHGEIERVAPLHSSALSDISPCLRVSLFLASLAVAAGGCGQAPPSNPPAQARADAGGESRQPASTDQRTGAPRRRKDPRSPRPDVFFEHPLDVAREGKPDTADKPRRRDSPDPPREPVADGPASPSPGAETAPAVGAISWSDLISGDVLADEAKTIRARIADRLQAIGRFNAGYKELRQDAATLAALATVAVGHPEPPGWRPHARHVRDLAAAITAAATAPGDRNYQPARAAADRLEALLAGNVPGGLPESSEKTPLSELLTRVPLMYRLERTFDWMKRTVNTEPQFRKDATRLAHEAALLATLAQVITDPGYPDADLDDYRAYAGSLSAAGLAVAQAARESDYRAYAAALDRCGKACTGCHQDFKNN